MQLDHAAEAAVRTSRIVSIRWWTSIDCGLTRWRRENVSNWRVKRGAALGGDLDRLRGARGLRILRGGLFQNLDVAAHDHQQVVEIVGDAAGELAERVHLLRLGELLLDLRSARPGHCAAR